MTKRSRQNTLELAEVALVKAMLRRGDLPDPSVLAYFTRPGRTVNHARIHEIRQGKRFLVVPAASDRELETFLARWAEHDAQTGLHPDGDELVIKAREAMLNAIQG